FLKVEMLRKHRRGRDDEESKKPAYILRSAFDEVPIRAQNRRSFLERPERRAELDHIDRMQLKFERSHHSEISATATDRPKDVVIFFAVCRHKAPIGQHHVHRE